VSKNFFDFTIFYPKRTIMRNLPTAWQQYYGFKAVPKMFIWLYTGFFAHLHPLNSRNAEKKPILSKKSAFLFAKTRDKKH
jgi:hypothetical protein